MNWKFLTKTLTPDDIDQAIKAAGITKRHHYNIVSGKTNNMKYIDQLLIRAEQRKNRIEKAIEWNQAIEKLAY